MTNVFPFDLFAKFDGLNFFVSTSGGRTIFFLDWPFAMFLTLFGNDFFFPLIGIYLVFDLFSIASPHDKLYFLLFSAIMNFNTLGSSSSDRLFHFWLLWDFPLTFLSLMWVISSMPRVPFLLSIFLSLMRSLQKELRSIFYLERERLPLISDATNEECGRAIIRLANELFYLESLRNPYWSWPRYWGWYLNFYAAALWPACSFWWPCL